MRISRIHQFRSLRTQSIEPIIAAAIVLAAISSALAQDDYTRGGPAAPAARVGNIYDHKRHQPTERDVRAAEKAARIPLPPSDNKAQVEEEVKNLLQQTDRLDKESEQKGHVIDLNDTHRSTK